jgi:L-ascorbate metabolism protein UlaG (beta-lactamase superfamily)
MKIQFVNHSSFIVEHDNVVLMIDPWLEGRVFNNGWDLISKTQFKFEDFERVTHIWFSHEHPDHFFPPNLNRISQDHRKNIIVLFQETVDKRVVDYCNKIGFKKTIELKPDTYEVLSPDLKVMCELYQEGDSWILIKSKEYTIFNTNDCGIRDKFAADKIQQRIGKIDLLLTQFSYAYWAGNKEDKEYRKKVADDKLVGLKFQVDIFKPEIVIPIASFVWFCHEENFYLNDEVNRPQKVVDFINQRTNAKAVLLYPGEEYWPNKEHQTANSIAKYNTDFETIMKGNGLVKGLTVEENELMFQAKNFVANLDRKYRVWAKLLSPTNIWITDYNKAFQLSLEKGLTENSLNIEDCDVSLSSESLLFNFKFPWGNDTLGINGRYQRPKNGNYSKFYNFFRYDQLTSRGIKVGINYFTKMAVRRLLVKTGLQKV